MHALTLLGDFMYNTTDAHQRGLDEGMDIALNMLNEAMGTKAENLGQAVAHVEIMCRQMRYLREDYSALLQDLKGKNHA